MRDFRRGQDGDRDNPNMNAQPQATTTAEGSNTHGTVNQHPSASTAPSQAHHSGLSRAAAGASGRLPFRVGIAEDRNKRWRRSMEDSHAFIYDFGGIRGQGFFSVFDGHAGKHAAEFCGKHFHEYLLTTIVENPVAPIPDVLNKAFQRVDRRLSEQSKQQGSSSGCTAVTAFLRLETDDGKPAGAPETGGVVPSIVEASTTSAGDASSSSTSATSPGLEASEEDNLHRRFRTGSSSHFGGAAAANAGEDEDTAPQIIRLNAPPTDSAQGDSRGKTGGGDGIFSSFTRRLRQYSGDRNASATGPPTPPKNKRKSFTSAKSPSAGSASLASTSDASSESHSQQSNQKKGDASVGPNKNAQATTSEDGLVEVEGKNVRRVLYTGNVGDARAVLCRAGEAVRLTYDHKGSDPQETERIQGAGGYVMNNRVNGVLAVTRSLGDSSMKDFVLGAPYTTETTLEADDTFLIVACDGLWDVAEDQEAVDLIKDVTDPQEASEVLLKHALDNFSTDNISVMVVRFAVKGENAADISVDNTAKGQSAGTNAGAEGKAKAEAEAGAAEVEAGVEDAAKETDKASETAPSTSSA
ncbi:hypothetical protein CF319_g1449 [Tilletia indica]|nr:hypothetical protein CF319_g1449 [Tilletia indica]KAE8234799.1 hypothetical protein CF326_g146 [Tilletia indica]